MTLLTVKIAGYIYTSFSNIYIFFYRGKIKTDGTVRLRTQPLIKKLLLTYVITKLIIINITEIMVRCTKWV